MSTEKLCVFCKALEYDEAGHGEYADPAKLSCAKGHKLSGRTDTQIIFDIEDFRAMIMTAKNCPDYEEAK